MKKQEYEEKQKQVADLILELNNAVIENDNPFNVKDGELAYYYTSEFDYDDSAIWDDDELKSYVPCKDKEMVKEFAKQTKLNWLLKKFSVDNDAVVTEDMWKDDKTRKWNIIYNNHGNNYVAIYTWEYKELSTIYFISDEVAQRAINEVVIPFNNCKL